MNGHPNQSLRAAFFSTMQGRIIGVLVIISLLLGIAYEGLQLATSIVAYDKLRSERNITKVQERAQTQLAPDLSTLYAPQDPFSQSSKLKSQRIDEYAACLHKLKQTPDQAHDVACKPDPWVVCALEAQRENKPDTNCPNPQPR
jgi:hypothetical protein